MTKPLTAALLLLLVGIAWAGEGTHILTPGSTEVAGSSQGLRRALWTVHDTKTDDVDQALIALHVRQTTNPGCPNNPTGIGRDPLTAQPCTLNAKVAVQIFQYSMPDNGGDSSGATLLQTGGGNALSAYRVTGLRPTGLRDYAGIGGYGIETGTDANWYALGIFVGFPGGGGGPANFAGGLLVNLADQPNPNANGKGILINPQNTVFDGRTAYATGTPVIGAADTTLHYQVLLNGNTGFGGPAINSPSAQVTIYPSEAGANLRLAGNGTQTPSKTLRAESGGFDVVDDAYTAVLFRVAESLTPGATSILVRRNVAGTVSLVPVTMGDADSGGAGFRMLRVVN